MKEVDIRNFSIISDLVEKAFSLSSTSLAFFKQNLNSGENIAPEFLSIMDEDRRLRINLSQTEVESFDEGWRLFTYVFDDFVRENKIEYSHFNSNTFNGKKLFKAVIANSLGKEVYYTKRFCEKSRMNYLSMEWMKEPEKIQFIVKNIGTKKLPKSKKFEIVLSANFADWFLCSTTEKWSSCIDLDSDWDSAYWSGLPGLVGDKNRAMVYLTDGSKKNYMGIEVDKVIARAFSFLTEEGHLYLLKNYPLDLLGPVFLEHCFPTFKFFSYKDRPSYISKYPITPLYFNESSGCFIFNDNCEFEIKENKMYLTSNGGGYETYNEHGILEDCGPAFYSGGLSKLIESGEQISDHFEDFYICEECGLAVSLDDVCMSGDTVYCSECYTTALEDEGEEIP